MAIVTEFLENGLNLLPKLRPTGNFLGHYVPASDESEDGDCDNQTAEKVGDDVRRLWLLSVLQRN
jgi:hypothetical protein